MSTLTLFGEAVVAALVVETKPAPSAATIPSPVTMMRKRFMASSFSRVVSSTFAPLPVTGIRPAADAVCRLPARSLRVLRNGWLTSS